MDNPRSTTDLIYTFMSDALDLPLAMLVTSVAFRPGGVGTLHGYWYFRDSRLPSTREERKKIASDLNARACVPVDLTGTQRQIAELMMLAVAAETEGDVSGAITEMRELLEKLTSTLTSFHDFDNVNTPRGTALPVDFPVEVDTDFPSLKKVLFSHPDVIRLQLHPGWSLWDGIQSSL